MRERTVVCENERNRRKDSMCVGSRERWSGEKERMRENACKRKKQIVCVCEGLKNGDSRIE